MSSAFHEANEGVHRVHGKEVRYVECVFTATIPPIPTPPIPSTSQLSVEVVSTGDIEDGLPAGEINTFSTLVTEPNNPETAPSAPVTFNINGETAHPVGNESLVPNEFDALGHRPTSAPRAVSLVFSSTGLFTTSATVDKR